jgi:capsule polysaccharide export protein KpsE/RkpR
VKQLIEKLIPWAISGVSLLFVILTYVRNGNKDKKMETKEDEVLMHGIKESLLKVNMKLDQVCSTTNETRTDIKSLNKDMQNLDIKVAILERDLKTAFTLIDELKAQ